MATVSSIEDLTKESSSIKTSTKESSSIKNLTKEPLKESTKEPLIKDSVKESASIKDLTKEPLKESIKESSSNKVLVKESASIRESTKETLSIKESPKDCASKSSHSKEPSQPPAASAPVENGKSPPIPECNGKLSNASQSQSTKKDSSVKPVFTLPVVLSPKRSKLESSKKQESTFIKVDYLKPAKVEKVKESVARVLNFTPVNGVKAEPEVDVKTTPIDEKLPECDNKTSVTVEKSSDENKPATVKVEREIEKKPDESPIKTEIKKEPGTSIKHSSSSKSSSHHSSSNHKSHSSSSSHHKSSSHKSSHSSSSKDCSRCYRRSKIKKVNASVQVRAEESKVLEFEASHRVGVNREPVAIDTNLSYLKYGRFYHIEVHPNGGASVVHMYQDELNVLSQEEMNELAEEFFELVFSEDESGFAYHVMGVVHDAARYLPDLLEHMAENYSNLTVKAGVLGRNNDIETCTMLQYYEQVMKTYEEGTVRYGPLHQISLVGKVHEEVGGYFPDLIDKLENNPFLNKSMPWGKLSVVQMDPRLSNDGPILWIRPGEQLIPTADLKTPLKRQRARINELRNLQYLPRSSEAREIMFEDRTKAHADHVGMGHERQTTAAVGKLKLFICVQNLEVDF